MLLLLSDERFLPGQAVEGKCQLSVPSYKASMVVGQTQKPLHIFSRAGSRPVLDGLYKSALNSNLLWNKAHFFGLNFKLQLGQIPVIEQTHFVGWPGGPQSPYLEPRASTIFQVRPCNTKFMGRKKVAGALDNPNPIQTNSYSPYRMTKAGFLWSSARILIW